MNILAQPAAPPSGGGWTAPPSGSSCTRPVAIVCSHRAGCPIGPVSQTYDRGRPEFMTLSPEHEIYKKRLGRLVERWRKSATCR